MLDSAAGVVQATDGIFPTEAISKKMGEMLGKQHPDPPPKGAADKK